MIERPEATEAGPGHLETIIALHAKGEQSVGEHQRFVERVVSRIGRPRTLYALIAFVVLWGLVNEALPRLFGRRPFDEPPFFWLQGLLALYASLVTTMVLTTQNRSQKAAQHRSYLELQVNLMAEEKTTKLIALMEELRRDLPNMRNRIDTEAELMSHTVDPHAVLTALEENIGSMVPPEPVDLVPPR